MATAGKWTSLEVKLDPQIISALENLGYPTMTPCQAAGVSPIIRHQDVAVDAETGSGKTLSFLVPIAQLLLFSANSRCTRRSPGVRALIIVPTRELAAQVHAASQALFAKLPGDVVPVPLIGGESAKHGAGPSPKYRDDCRVLIATPGRLNAAMNAGAVCVRDLEVLIMDEADRLLDMGFSVALTSILTRLPKQRRTGLYSATQTEQVDELARAGLRNPVRVTVRVKTVSAGKGRDGEAGKRAVSDGAAAAATGQGKKRQVIPASLSCYYIVLRHDHKLHHFVRVLAAHPENKFIVYLLTCSSVDFFAKLPLHEMVRAVGGSEGEERRIVPLHGKMSQTKRTRSLEAFATCSNALLICTDVAARGLDIPDVDWVVQFDPPQDPDAYVHRVGRTARLGREGSSLIYLAPHEDAYADFLSVRRCPVKPFVFEEDESKGVAGPSSESAAQGVCLDKDICDAFVALIRKTVVADRAVLDAAEKGFLSYLRAYKEHRCSFLLPFADLDIGSVARSFSLVRLPRFQEFRKHRATLDFEKDESIRVRDITYQDKMRERKRQAEIAFALDNRKERRDTLKQKSKKGKKRKSKQNSSQNPSADANGKDPSQSDDEGDMEDLYEEARLLRKTKRGKLSQRRFDAAAGYDSADDSVSAGEANRVESEPAA
jgi:ATP-dependent RNA helicase DDX55/SPB4